MAARKSSAHSANYVRLSESHRAKIQNSSILNALIEHVGGTRDMSSTQVTAALGLLKKCLPDLQAVSLNGGTDENGNPSEIVIRVIKPER